MKNWLITMRISKSDGTFNYMYLTVYAKNYDTVVAISTLLEESISSSVCVMIKGLL